jgi:hypothetical protein
MLRLNWSNRRPRIVVTAGRITMHHRMKSRLSLLPFLAPVFPEER